VGRVEKVEYPLLLEIRRDRSPVRLAISEGSSWRVWETMASEVRELRHPICGGTLAMEAVVKREPISSPTTVDANRGRRGLSIKLRANS